MVALSSNTFLPQAAGGAGCGAAQPRFDQMFFVSRRVRVAERRKRSKEGGREEHLERTEGLRDGGKV